MTRNIADPTLFAAVLQTSETFFLTTSRSNLIVEPPRCKLIIDWDADVTAMFLQLTFTVAASHLHPRRQSNKSAGFVQFAFTGESNTN
jgi:hypothetical protein